MSSRLDDDVQRGPSVLLSRLGAGGSIPAESEVVFVLPGVKLRPWSGFSGKFQLMTMLSTFELIDEENRVPHGTDESLLKKLYAAHEHDRADGEPLFSPPKVTATAKRQSTAHRLSAFVVHHFAGQVRHGALPYV